MLSEGGRGKERGKMKGQRGAEGSQIYVCGYGASISREFKTPVRRRVALEDIASLYTTGRTYPSPLDSIFLPCIYVALLIR